MLSGLLDTPEQFPGWVAAMVTDADLRQPQQGAQRRANLVAHVRQERALQVGEALALGQRLLLGRFHRAALGDVVAGAEDAVDVAGVVAQEIVVPGKQAHLTVGTEHLVLEVGGLGDLATHQAFEHGLHEFLALRPRHAGLEPVATDQFRLRIAEQCAAEAIDQRDPPVPIQSNDQRVDGIEIAPCRVMLLVRGRRRIRPRIEIDWLGHRELPPSASG